MDLFEGTWLTYWMLQSPKVQLPNNMGFVAYFTDSEGNVMGLWSM